VTGRTPTAGTSDQIADLAGGMDTVRGRRHPEDIARRAVGQADARGNLAAMMCDEQGVDPRGARDIGPGDPRLSDPAARRAAAQYDLLADILGLAQEPERPPGLCACGAELPMTSTSAHNRTQYGPGQCGQCTRAARRPTAVRAGTYPTRTRRALLEAARDGRIILDGHGDARLDGWKVNSRYDDGQAAGWLTLGKQLPGGSYRVALTDAGRAVLGEGA
jgi:hypothetical protein